MDLQTCSDMFIISFNKMVFNDFYNLVHIIDLLILLSPNDLPI